MAAAKGYTAPTDKLYELAKSENEPTISFPLFNIVTKTLRYSLCLEISTYEIQKIWGCLTVKKSI